MASGSFTPTQPGIYRFTATYSGDTSADFDPLIIDTLVGRDQMLTPETPIRVLRVPTQSTTCYQNEYDGEVTLRRALEQRPRARLLLSGGTTPAPGGPCKDASHSPRVPV